MIKEKVKAELYMIAELEFVSNLTGIPPSEILLSKSKYRTNYARRMLTYLLVKRGVMQTVIAKSLGTSNTSVFLYKDESRIKKEDLEKLNKFLIGVNKFALGLAIGIIKEYKGGKFLDGKEYDEAMERIESFLQIQELMDEQQ